MKKKTFHFITAMFLIKRCIFYLTFIRFVWCISNRAWYDSWWASVCIVLLNSHAFFVILWAVFYWGVTTCKNQLRYTSISTMSSKIKMGNCKIYEGFLQRLWTCNIFRFKNKMTYHVKCNVHIIYFDLETF